MMSRVRTAALHAQPVSVSSDATWGLTYVRHGLAGVGLVGLVIAHVYFAVRPEKWWITKSMIFGCITRRQYLEHHEPSALAGRQPTGRRKQSRRARRERSGESCGRARRRACNTIEEAYEFMLAYASQGLSSDQDSAPAARRASSSRAASTALDRPRRLPHRIRRAARPRADGGLRRVHRGHRPRCPRRAGGACSWCWRSRRSARSWSTT